MAKHHYNRGFRGSGSSASCRSKLVPPTMGIVLTFPNDNERRHTVGRQGILDVRTLHDAQTLESYNKAQYSFTATTLPADLCQWFHRAPKAFTKGFTLSHIHRIHSVATLRRELNCPWLWHRDVHIPGDAGTIRQRSRGFMVSMESCRSSRTCNAAERDRQLRAISTCDVYIGSQTRLRAALSDVRSSGNSCIKRSASSL